MSADRWPVREMRAGRMDKSRFARSPISEFHHNQPGSEIEVPEMRQQERQSLDRRAATQVNVTDRGQFSDFAPELLQAIEKVPKNRQVDKVLMLTSDSC